jgi:hypothetical protein
MEQQIGVTLNRILADAGYRGHHAPPASRLKVYTAGQKRRMTEQIRRQLRRRSAVEPVIGHTSKPTTAWTAITSPTALAMPTTRCLPLPATISAGCWPG